MFKRTALCITAGSLLLTGQLVSAQDGKVSNEEIRGFLDASSRAAASKSGDCDHETYMKTGVCPGPESKEFRMGNVSTGPANKPTQQNPQSRAKYTTSRGNKPAYRPGPAILSLPASRISLNMRLSFDLNSAELTPAARAQADIFAEELNKGTPGVDQLVIEGHTDSIGSRAYNKELSQRRAQAVVDYLVSRGVPASKLRAVGYGFDAPIPGTLASNPENRRVEIATY